MDIYRRQKEDDNRSEEFITVGLANQDNNVPVESIAAEIGMGITPKFIGVILLRVVFYAISLFYLDSDGMAYEIIDGIMLADLMTWFLFSIIQLPFKDKKFLIEFCAYGLMISILGAMHKITFILPGKGAVGLTFLIVAPLKAVYWAYFKMMSDDEER